MIAVRKEHDVFSGGHLDVIPTGNDHVLGFRRVHAGRQAIVFANFSETRQRIGSTTSNQYTNLFTKKLNGNSILHPGKDLFLEPLDLLVLC